MRPTASGTKRRLRVVLPSGVDGGAIGCGAVREVLRALGGEEGAWRSMMETLGCFGRRVAYGADEGVLAHSGNANVRAR